MMTNLQVKMIENNLRVQYNTDRKYCKRRLFLTKEDL